MHQILVVEDETAYLKLLNEQLTANGYEVKQARDGKSGLTLAKSGHSDLILLDIRLPDMDGISMLDSLRKDPTGKNTKVILLTNLEPDAKIIDGVIRNKPICYLIKSDIKIKQLLAKIKEVLPIDKMSGLLLASFLQLIILGNV